MQEEHIDWEAVMKETSQLAKQAARNSERTLGGVAEVLRSQKSQVKVLSALGKSQKELLDLLSSEGKAQQIPGPTAHHGSASAPRLWSIILLSPGIGAIVALAVFGMS
ncbi:MAG: hypothetical protein ACU0BN_14085 [Sulfitobacter sp.]